VDLLAQNLRDAGETVVIRDLARDDMADAVAEAFRCGRIVLATTTYNTDIFPPMKEYLHWLLERNFQNRIIGLMENGTWAPQAAKVMRGLLESCKDLTILEPAVRITAALNDTSTDQLTQLSEALISAG